MWTRLQGPTGRSVESACLRRTRTVNYVREVVRRSPVKIVLDPIQQDGAVCGRDERGSNGCDERINSEKQPRRNERTETNREERTDCLPN